MPFFRPYHQQKDPSTGTLIDARRTDKQTDRQTNNKKIVMQVCDWPLTRVGVGVRRTGVFVRPSFPSQTLLINEQSTAWAGWFRGKRAPTQRRRRQWRRGSNDLGGCVVAAALLVASTRLFEGI